MRVERTSAEPQHPGTLQGARVVCHSCSPKSAAAQNKEELVLDGGLADAGSYLLGALNTQTTVIVTVPSGDKYLEPDPLASTGLTQPEGTSPGKSQWFRCLKKK